MQQVPFSHFGAGGGPRRLLYNGFTAPYNDWNNLNNWYDLGAGDFATELPKDGERVEVNFGAGGSGGLDVGPTVPISLTHYIGDGETTLNATANITVTHELRVTAFAWRGVCPVITDSITNFNNASCYSLPSQNTTLDGSAILWNGTSGTPTVTLNGTSAANGPLHKVICNNSSVVAGNITGAPPSEFYGTSRCNATIVNAEFYDLSHAKNLAIITNGWFYDSSYTEASADIVNGEFNDTSYTEYNSRVDYGTFNNSSRCEGRVDIHGIFNNFSYAHNLGDITQTAVFNDDTYHDCAFSTGPITFNDNSYNSGLIQGDATFNDNSSQLGTVWGVTTCSTTGTCP